MRRPSTTTAFKSTPSLLQSSSPSRFPETHTAHRAMRVVPIIVVKEPLGHSDIPTTMRYAYVSPAVRTSSRASSPRAQHAATPARAPRAQLPARPKRPDAGRHAPGAHSCHPRQSARHERNSKPGQSVPDAGRQSARRAELPSPPARPPHTPTAHRQNAEDPVRRLGFLERDRRDSNL
ncbi:MAG: hypothetical protein ACJA1R_002378 [Flavobacteriales bacterium]|jgi:hypothetical protein